MINRGERIRCDDESGLSLVQSQPAPYTRGRETRNKQVKKSNKLDEFLLFLLLGKYLDLGFLSSPFFPQKLQSSYFFLTVSHGMESEGEGGSIHRPNFFIASNFFGMLSSILTQPLVLAQSLCQAMWTANATARSSFVKPLQR